ncbi:MAG: ribokinase [Candidatus Izemoplasmatales bacterium]
MKRIYVLGSINMDLVFELDKLPLKGETVHSNKFFMTPGGKGANQAIACARQEIDTYMIGSVGKDSLSEACLQSLKSASVHTEYVTKTDQASVGVAGILLENNDNRIIVDSGANKYQKLQVIEEALAKGDAFDILIAQLEIPLEIILSSFKLAREKGMKTILNAAPAYPLPIELYEHVDLLVVNETETNILTGIEPTNEEQTLKALNLFLEYGVKEVIITLGDQGSIYYSANKQIKEPAKKVQVVDTTAAGDTYLGVYASSMLQGFSIEKSMKLATIASSITISRYGAGASIPTKKEIEVIYKEDFHE